MGSSRWKQYHLSTAILLVVTAGILMGLNLKRDGSTLVFRGWPLPAQELRETQPPRSSTHSYDDFGHLTDVRVLPNPTWSVLNILVDAIVCLGTLALVFYACERRIQRRAVEAAEEPAGGEQT